MSGEGGLNPESVLKSMVVIQAMMRAALGTCVAKDVQGRESTKRDEKRGSEGREGSVLRAVLLNSRRRMNGKDQKRSDADV